MNREQQERDRYKQTLKEVQQIVLNIKNDEDFVGEGKLWQMVFDIEKIINKVKRKTKKAKMEQGIRKAIRILMEGRTYYDGYFDVPFEKLSRIDQATKVLLDSLENEAERD